jgi:hypothetical protein
VPANTHPANQRAIERPRASQGSGATHELETGRLHRDAILTGQAAEQLVDRGKTSESPQRQPDKKEQQDEPGGASGNPVPSRNRPGQAGGRANGRSNQHEEEAESKNLPENPARQPHDQERRADVTGDAGGAQRCRRTGDERGQDGTPILLSDPPLASLKGD